MSATVKTEVGRFMWHDLVTNDVEGAKKFYTELLGWGIDTWKPGEMDYPMIMANDQAHGGFRDPGQEVPSHWVGYVIVEDVDKTVKKAQKAGATIHREPFDVQEVGRIAVIGDPQGAIIAPMTPAGEPATSAGTFVWDELVADDIDAAKSFYEEVIGWKPTDVDMGPAGTYTLWKRDGDTDAGGALKKPSGAQGPPMWLTYLATDDVDVTVKRAKELGANAMMEGTDVENVGRLAVIQDPTGALVGLFKPSES